MSNAPLVPIVLPNVHSQYMLFGVMLTIEHHAMP